MPVACAASSLAFAAYTRVLWPDALIGWVAFAPWLAALDRARSHAGALACGWLFAVAFSLAVFPWFASGMAAYTGLPVWVGFLALALLAPLVQLQLVVYAIVRHFARGGAAQLAPRAVVAAALLYVGAEWAFPKLFGDTVGHGFQASARMRQAADLAGAHGLTFLLLLGNECALRAARALTGAGAARQRLLRALAPAGLLLALPLVLAAYGSLRLRQLEPRETGPPLLTAGIVQADISFYARLRRQLGSYEAVRRILDRHFALSHEALARAPLDLLLWPETVYPTTFGTPRSEEGAAFDREIGAFVARTGVPLVFGAYDVGPGGEFNAAVFLDPGEDGRIEFETYRKSWLFPLTERVPRWLDSARVRAWLPWLGSWQPGAGPRLTRLGLPDGRELPVAPLICYDAVVPGFAIEAARAGAKLLVTLSNDSWFDEGEGPHLHLVVSAFRSLETRLPQVRATNTGISAVISATGELLAVAGVHERAALVAAVPAGPQAATLMLAWGDWFPPAALAGGLLLFAAGRWKR